MAKQDKIAQITPRIRDGEGVLVATTRRMVPRPDGTTSFEMSVDMGEAPVPERRYVADIASVNYRDGTIYLVFGQRKLVGSRLRTMVVLTMSSLGVLNFLKACESIAPEVLKKFVSRISCSSLMTLKRSQAKSWISQLTLLLQRFAVVKLASTSISFPHTFLDSSRRVVNLQLIR